VIRDSVNGAIGSLTTDGTNIYGTGWAFGAGATFEGTFVADPADGRIIWLDDCLGDNYSASAIGNVVYSVGHSHDCTMIDGFPDTSPRVRWQHSLAFTKAATGVNKGPDVYGWNKAGQPAPTLLHWFPTWSTGSATGQYQAGWSITGNSSYVVVAGEFPYVNNGAQQGLVRFGIGAAADNRMAPTYTTNPPRDVPTTAAAVRPGTVRVAYASAWDKDNESLTYQVVRDGATNIGPAVQYRSNFWTLPVRAVDDVTVPAGNHTYQVRVTDPFGNQVLSPVSNSVAAVTSLGAYGNTVLGDAPLDYWRLGEGSGNIAVDSGSAGLELATRPGLSWGAAGAVSGSSAATVNGTSTGTAATTTSIPAPETFSVEAWFRTTTTSGGRIVGFGDSQAGTSSNYDRHVYLTNTGQVVFGVYNGARRTVSTTTAYNDGQWHHVVATLGAQGMSLHLDGALVSRSTAVTTAPSYRGYWRIGGDNLSGWPSAPTSRYFAGTVDEVAVYGSALTSSQISNHSTVGRGGAPSNTAPTAAFSSSVTGLSATVNAAASSDPDGSITSYAWRFGDGATASGATASHTYAAAGTYPVTLTVTDNAGATGTTTASVTVTGGSTLLARDSFTRTVANGWGSAETGGPWTLQGAGSFAVSGGRGSMALASAGAESTASLASVSSTDTDVQLQFALDKPATGGGQFVSVIGRGTLADGYRAQAWIAAGGAVEVALLRLVGGVETELGSAVLTGVSYSPGTLFSLRLQVWGTGTTSLRARVWRSSDAQPTLWAVSASDATAALQASRGVGVVGYLSSTATNAPVVLSVDELTAGRTGN
jgi:PKD repeat protein